jgi:cobalt-precorrin 5A hydrolase
MNGIAVITLSPRGEAIGRKLCAEIPGARLYVQAKGLSCCRSETLGARPLQAGKGRAESPRSRFPTAFASVCALTAGLFPKVRGLVFILPAGVAVRAIAPLAASKKKDPAVVVVDVAGRWAVSLLSGHEGGANDLAVRVANVLGAEPIVTTTTEAEKRLIVGVGCRRGVSAAAILAAIRESLSACRAKPADVRLLASVDIKKNEKGLLAAAARLRIPLVFIASDEIRQTRRKFSISRVAREKMGLPAVAEPAALLAGRRTRLLVPRIARRGVTVAVAEESFSS